jgi:enamine deaminase RidA (YjgF/YER057c/UK114 family)|tara:strand:+ start:190 stop:579 length:390 start_codon:yes stop_codon:yes gene_type:complete
MKLDKKLFRDGPYSDFFSQGVQVGNILTLAGQLGDGEDGEIPESIKGQMENCYRHIQNVLNEFGASLDNVIDETWFVTDVEDCMDNVGEIFQARERIYGCKPEVSQTLIGTTALVAPSYKIEIKCIAHL